MAIKSDIVKAEAAAIQPVEQIESLILTIRGKQVILDRDLARLYGVETFRLNEQVKRNIERFPEDFMFQLTKEEFENWKSQIVTSIPNENMSSQNARTSNADMLSQIAMTSAKRRPASALPYAFTENGIAMLSSVLRSPMAIATNIHITPIEVKQFDRAHDRFLCIDDTVYLIGASLKDLGKKWFGFVKLEQPTDELLSKM